MMFMLDETGGEKNKTTNNKTGNRTEYGIMRNVYKKLAMIMCSLLLVSSLCGCDMFTKLDLTEEESGLIAEYAAGLLRKYDTKSKLKEPASEDAEIVSEPVEEPSEESVSELVEELPDGTYTEPVAGTETDFSTDAAEPDFFDITEGSADKDLEGSSVTESETWISSSDIAELVNASDCDISYLGYELCDIYPDNADNSWLISMSAQDGRKLCVLKFQIMGLSGEDTVCNILNSGKSYRLIVNGSKRINETVTVLMDSFSQFNDVIPSGESKEAVLVFEMENELADSIDSLDLIIKDKYNSDTVSLK